MLLEVLPYIGVGSIHFDESYQDVEKLLNSATSRRDFPASRMFSYDDLGLHFHFDIDDKLREVEALRPDVFSIGGIPLWEAEFLSLASTDEGAAIYGAVLILPAYGIASCGFHSGLEDEQTITAFRRGVWSSKLSTARLYQK